jgi:UDP-N-acetylmuramate dehydrogenase
MNMVEANNLMAAGLRGELRLREPMARHTSWRAGGAAERAYFPADLSPRSCARCRPRKWCT